MMIWEMAGLQPRVVDIYDPKVKKLQKNKITRFYSTLKPSTRMPLTVSRMLLTHTPAPAVLHACREARNHLTRPALGARGSGYYQQVYYFGYKTGHWLKWAGKPRFRLDSEVPYVWVNIELDKIDIGLEGIKLYDTASRTAFITKASLDIFQVSLVSRTFRFALFVPSPSGHGGLQRVALTASVRHDPSRIRLIHNPDHISPSAQLLLWD